MRKVMIQSSAPGRAAPRRLRHVLCLAALLAAGCAAEAQRVSPAATASATQAVPAGWHERLPPSMAVTSRFGMVTSTDRIASEVGAEVLRRGGNAVDAAVAVHFALAVVNPEAGNIGGGGFLVAHMADGATAALDFRETAPQAATRDMFLDAQGNVTQRSLVGHLAAGVPGSVAGMWAAHQRLGSMPWAELLAPAIALADGLVMHERLATSLQSHESRFREFASTAAVFLPQGRAPRVGERFEQRDLAETLRRVARDGRDGFYRGRTAELVEAEMRRGGGIMTRDDLGRYRAVWRDAVVFDYRGHRVVSMPPPSSGGATLAATLKILEGYDLQAMGGWHSPDHIHLFTEAVRRAYADRNEYLADPDFVPQPVARMISDDYAAERRATISLARATPSAAVRPGFGPAPTPAAAPRTESDNTTHYSVVDARGNAVAVTTTINSLYGNRVVVQGAGFFLNNEMDDFTAQPGTPNQFGLVQGEANIIQPGKRMLSAMTPTIVLDPDGRVLLVTGSPGGSTIITTVAQIVSNVVDWRMDLVSATTMPRLHHQHLPDELRFEVGGLLPATVEELRRRGHTVEQRPGYQGDVQSIMRRPDGSLVGVADPRRGGAAVGVREILQVVQ
jgi:gamma-glutamyltranspeptidase / glutathione hydrolase